MQFDDMSIQILRCIFQHQPLDITGLIIYTSFEPTAIDERINKLLTYQLIKIDDSYEYAKETNAFRLTTDGEIVLENESKHRKDHDFNEFRAWVTLLIAIVALILSIVK